MAAALLTAQAAGAAPATGDRVQVQMKNVVLHMDETTVVAIDRLRGELVPSQEGRPPVFDDKASFTVRIDSAEIAVTARSLTGLLNGYVFAYEGSPLKHLDVTIVGNQLKVTGTMKTGISVPFTIVADPTVDADGNLRLHPASIKALGVPAKGLLSFFGVELEKLIHVSGDRGVRIDGDDFVLTPSKLLPPPRIEGRLQAVRVERDRIVQTFGPGHDQPLSPPEPRTNYMYYRGGILRFGKLTMTDVDMELIDRQPRDPFDFFQDKYNEQLVAGYSKNTPSHGLKVYMPDYRALHPAAASGGTP